MSLDDDTKIVMEEVLADWRDYRRGGYSAPAGNADGAAGAGAGNGNGSGSGNVAVTLGSGEWDEGLGLPLCVVCQSVSWEFNAEIPLEKKKGEWHCRYC